MARTISEWVELWWPRLTRKEQQVNDDAPGKKDDAKEDAAEETLAADEADEAKDAPAEGADAADPYAHLGSNAPTGDDANQEEAEA